jgi:transcriptional regulator with XRE-family HTH domain
MELLMTKASSEKKFLSDFATKVRSRRHQLGMTQEELAEKADFHVNFIGAIERSNGNPSLTSIVILARALELSPKDLMPNR